jgi:hypothetical protein
VLESLRMHPPVPFAMRHVQADASRVLVGGTTEPAASDLFVQFVIGDIGRDSEMWKDPDEFRPESGFSLVEVVLARWGKPMILGPNRASRWWRWCWRVGGSRCGGAVSR